MAEIYKDYLPANARVIVDYTAKEKVKFHYPREWTYNKAVWKCAFPTITTFWMMVNVYFLFALVAVFGVPFMIYYWINKIVFVKSEIISAHVVNYGLSEILLSFLGIVLYFGYLMGLPALYTWYLSRDKERLAKVIPKLGHLNSRLANSMKEKIFMPDDVYENKAIIHSFSNVFLEYKCFGEFNKYLERIEIFEIPFDYVKKSIFRKKKTEKNDLEFRAVFHFKQKPMSGRMEVEFS